MKMRGAPNFLWITDPWETLDHARDTSLRLAQEAHLLGYPSYWCDVRSIRFEKGNVYLEAQKFLKFSDSPAPARNPQAIVLAPKKTCRLDAFTSLHYRTDPPVDLAYLQPLQILGVGLELAAQKNVKNKMIPELVNPLEILTTSNEKIAAGALGHLMPPTLAASLPSALKNFGLKNQRVVLKPLHQAQSKGVELLDYSTLQGQASAEKKLEAATDGFTRPVLLQRFLKGIEKGEQRLWFLDGRVLAHVRKLPLEKDFRVDIDRGSPLAQSTLNAREKSAAVRIGTYLNQRGIRLAAVDLIEGKVTDFNFTSPGLIVPMEKILKRNLAQEIILGLAAGPKHRPHPQAKRSSKN